MTVFVTRAGGGYRLDGDSDLIEIGNRWLAHLVGRNYSPATVRGYAFDLVSLGRFLEHAGIEWAELAPSDVFGWLEWQRRPVSNAGEQVARIGKARGAAPSTINRSVAAARGLFEYALMCGVVDHNPVPAPRRSSGLRARRSGLLGHAAGRRTPGPARLVRQDRPLPETVDAADIDAFFADLNTHRDRAITLAMLLGGLRASEVRGLRLADVDVGARQVLVVGKGNKTRVVPIDRPFFTEVRAYLDRERPRGLVTPECFVVLRSPTAGQAMTEAGLRKIFRTHRGRTGAMRVRPHRLRHTFGTDLAAAGIDVLVLRELMGHAHVETTTAYVHLAPEVVADEWARVRGASQ